MATLLTSKILYIVLSIVSICDPSESKLKGILILILNSFVQTLQLLKLLIYTLIINIVPVPVF